MENLKIELESDNGETIDYNIDSEILKGLYLTMDTPKIDENIKNFNLDIEAIPNEVATKMSKRNKVAIVTIVVDDQRKYQYLIGRELDINEVENTESQLIPEQMKGLIRQAYNLAQSK